MRLDVHHIGVVVVDNIDAAKKTYEHAFDMAQSGSFIVDAFRSEVCFLPAATAYIELVRSLADDGLGNFLKKHGPGTLHHICYLVADIEEAVTYFTEEKGLRSAAGAPAYRPCFEKAMFFHPKDTGKVLVEVVNEATCRLPIL